MSNGIGALRRLYEVLTYRKFLKNWDRPSQRKAP
jgi:hypothetical protein